MARSRAREFVRQGVSEKLAYVLEQLGRPALSRSEPLTGGCIADVWKLTFTDGSTLVAKIGAPGDRLDEEGAALTLLGLDGRAPVPTVFHAEDALLVMSYVVNSGPLTVEVQRHAAEVISTLHMATQARYGFHCDGLIGTMEQPNAWSEKWVPFFVEHRFLFAVDRAVKSGGLKRDEAREAQRFARRLEEILDEPSQPSLLHGDLWGGNILSDGQRVTGLIDPAVYYGDPEMDLAFATLFQSLGAAFFDVYETLRPFDRKAFFDHRRDLYNLWPLLVHAALFGGAYGAASMSIIRRYS